MMMNCEEDGGGGGGGGRYDTTDRGAYELQQHVSLQHIAHYILLLQLNDTPLHRRKNLPCHETAEGDRGMTW